MMSLVAVAATVGIVIAAVTLVFVRLVHLQTRVHRRMLEAYLTGLRRVHYAKLGLQPRPARLRLQVRGEAAALLDEPIPPEVVLDPMVLADIEGAERVQVVADLKQLWGRVPNRWRTTLLLVTAAVTVVLALCSLLVPVPTWLPVSHGFLPSTMLWVLAGLCSLIVVFLVDSPASFAKSDNASKRAQRECQDRVANQEAEERARFLAGQAQIGGPDEVVRALHLSSGGFDTIMHLGVAHALWVIQGRAPDAIVGISAGAIQGVAIAEVLQAGESEERAFVAKFVPDAQADWTLLEDAQLAQLQEIRLLARTHRLRHFVEAAQRAPERLIDALIPDVYQIDATAPIRPLQGPRFPAQERSQRVAQLQSISGLTRLYNDLLGLSFSIATLTRFVRRILGWSAAADIQGRSLRFLVRCVESLRMGLLVGLHLMDVARLLPILLRAFRAPRFPAPRTAGVLLFQSMAIQKAFDWLMYGLSFVALLLVWALLSDFAIFLYVIVIIALLFYVWREPDDLLIKSAMVDGLRGFLWFCLVAGLWTMVAAALSFGLGILLVTVLRLAMLGPIHFNPRELGVDLRVTVGFAVIVAIALLLSALATICRALRNPQRYQNRLLASYDLANSILTEHGMRAFLVEMFDPGYYPRASMDSIVDQALKRGADAPAIGQESETGAKTVGYYSAKARTEPIHLGLAAADTATGRLEVVPRATLLVDALLASTAIVPWMPAVELKSPRDNQGRVRRTLFIDGANVSREPTRALLKMLRTRLHEGSKVVHIYSVTPFPVSRPNLDASDPPPPRADDTAPPAPSEQKPWLNLLDIAWRALRLQRFRDATLERRLTEAFSELMPGGSADAETSRTKQSIRMFRAWVTPVELEFDADVNRRILGATKDERRRIMYETIADGCRASMQVMIAGSIRAASGAADTDELTRHPCGSAHEPITVQCARAVDRHRSDSPIPESLKTVRGAGADPLVGPGLPEICQHCCLWRGTANARPQTLLLREWSEIGPSWPHERAVTADLNVTSRERFIELSATRSAREQVIDSMRTAKANGWMDWPRHDPKSGARASGPTVSLLFSGGVFRGVYQMGVVNALHEMKLRPDLIAGASVGSITAAMVADAFARDTELEQKARICRLASVYLTIDRLVMTDRLADFVRNLTLRAADTQFSVLEADRLFRKYDAPNWVKFDRTARHVIAGIERLLYVSPYELNRLVRAFRTQDLAVTAGALHRIVQQYLDRMQIGGEALGAEALELLIREYVIGDRESTNPAGFTIDELRMQSNVQFLATATNLTRGRLDVFGEKPTTDARSSAVLLEVLLASSAFPGVFRPRWSWEAEPSDGRPAQYIDGGVTDNLPLDAVSQFLERTASAGLIVGSPAAPHLVIAASLEVNAPQYILDFTREQLKQSWIVLSKRAKALGYNRKLDTYVDAQDRMRSVVSQLSAADRKSLSFTPVDLKVVAVKPNWLCGTFAFHPMLGFSRDRQARSIAHGCASTLLRIAQVAKDPDERAWMAAWNLNADELPQVTDWATAFELPRPPRGKCWLREGKDCPFSADTLRQMNAALQAQLAKGERPAKNCGEISEEMISALDRIYQVCPQRATHLRKI